MPVATATASPPLDPPALRSACHGLSVRPNRSLSVSHRMPKSGMLPRPTGTAPARRIRRTIVASCAGTAPAFPPQPLVVADHVRSMFSFTENGTPASGPGSLPAATVASMSAAAARARSAKTTVSAFTSGLRRAMRSRCASTTSSAATSPARTAAAIDAADAGTGIGGVMAIHLTTRRAPPSRLARGCTDGNPHARGHTPGYRRSIPQRERAPKPHDGAPRLAPMDLPRRGTR